MSKLSDKEAKTAEKEAGTEILFRNVTIVLVGILLYCIPGFLSFRNIAATHGLYFIRAEAWWWCLLGCVAFGTIKYTYYSLVKSTVLGILHPKFQGQERLYRLKTVSKLSFDVLFYSVASMTAYFLFKDEPWFPSMMGGEGQCNLIYRQFPNWPSELVSPKIQVYYMIQLGIHFFSMIQIVTIRRKTDRKYYEFLLHHFMATTLILFSLLTNNVAVGTIILFLHNFSDVTAAFVRALVETKFNSFLADAIFWVLAVVNWSYMRTVVFPFCVIKQVYDNIPGADSPWASIRFPQTFLIIELSILVCMHIFWLYFLVKTGIDMALGKGKTNAHDKPKVKGS